MCNSFLSKVKQRLGRSLKDGKAHTADHQQWSRRDFLYFSGLAMLGSSLNIGGTTVNAFAKSAMGAALNSSSGERILILIRLKGGNDGLNTIVPTHAYSSYLNRRPEIAIAESDLADLGEGYGLHPALSPLMNFWNEGKMKILQSVGYPNPNYSHFRSSDILATASDSHVKLDTGWLGRYFETEYSAYLEAPPSVPLAIQIGNSNDLAFKASEANMSVVFKDPNRFYNLAQSGQLYDTSNLPNCYLGEELGFLRGVTNNSFRFSESIKAAYDNATNAANYPGSANALAPQLAMVARLIKGNLGTRVYMVTLDGFDTHSNQTGQQNTILTYYTDAMQAFFADLQATGHTQNVLTVTFSEFGRTIDQNDSMGTDHAAASPVWVIGDEVVDTPENRILGEGPSELFLSSSANDIPYETDFRSMYATLLQDWLCVEPQLVDFVLGASFARVDNLLAACNPEIGSNKAAHLLGHKRDIENGGYQIKYAILQTGLVKLNILNAMGQQVVPLLDEVKTKGAYKFHFLPVTYNLPPGTYIYQIKSGGYEYSRPIKVE